jgi:2-keto-4-pentenoate hydratase/2-oxohepta-3-ene-1,7-dioic acid hydratase in catechol pathway
MKLVRVGPKKQEKPAVLTDDGSLIDVSEQVDDFDQAFFSSGGLEKLAEFASSAPASRLGPESRFGPPIRDPSKIICVGLNYAGHAKESGMALPKEPVLFFKATSSICGPNDPIVIPKGSVKTDWEVELAVVIGKRAAYVEEAEAMDHVAGYLLHNDVSERAFQLEREGQWVKGKSADTFAPIGPWLVTKEEIGDPQKLDLWLKVNGETVQSSNTSDMVFSVRTLVSYISQFMSLLPGDIISTGTPFGVGMGFDPPRYLRSGDVVELGVEGLGMAQQRVIAYEELQ